MARFDEGQSSGRDALSGVKKWGGIIIAVLIAFVVLSTIAGSFYTVDQNEVRVLKRNGAVVGTAGPGWHWKVPFIDSAESVPLEEKIARWEKLEGYSHDQQPAHYTISVNYRIDPSKAVAALVEWGGSAGIQTRIVTPQVLKLSKVSVGSFTAQTSVQQRAKLNNDILKLVTEATQGLPVIFSSINVEDILFSPEYMKSINDRMLAEVGVETERQKAEKEVQIARQTVTKAQALADSTLANKTAEAKGIELVGNSEAAAIKSKGAALRDNPILTEYIKADRWDGKLPMTMVPGGAVPMINLSGAPPAR